MLRIPTLVGLAFIASAASAANFDNRSGRYSFTPLPSAEAEMKRMNTIMQLSDQQPTGRYVRKGETVRVNVGGMPSGYRARAMVGFRRMIGKSSRNQQAAPLRNGNNRFVARQNGPLFITITAPAGKPAMSTEVDVSIADGKPLPLFVQGHTSMDDWRTQLDNYADAPFVQLVDQHSMITLPRGVFRRDPVADPSATLATIGQVLAMQDALAGFDDTKPADARTPLREHFVVDFRTSPKERKGMYMYATDQFIGMFAENTADLTDPARLRSEWAIWHEVGHTHQQDSWTWESLAEVSVNLFSLYVQEKMGEPNRLDVAEYDGITPRERARDYLARASRDYVSDVEGEYDDLAFVRLVMFDQLKRAYGWDLFTRLFRYYREHPLPYDVSEAKKVDQFVVAMCTVAGNDLRPFFEKWGLRASADAYGKIAALRLPVRAIET
jgi:hypothetical protein